MNNRVHFEGNWPEPEIRRVAAAITRVEARISDSLTPAFGKTWICVREQIDEASVLYVASRFGYHATVKALTAASLAEYIDDFGDVAHPYADAPR